MTTRSIATLVGLAAACATTVRAVVDDAHSYALEAAADAVAQGVELRADYAHGTLAPGGKAKVSYQVFKGSSYWFFVGGSEEGMEMSIHVTDADGKPVEGQRKSAPQAVVFHFTAKRTGMVTVEVSGRLPSPTVFNWAVVYGFRADGGGTKE